MWIMKVLARIKEIMSALTLSLLTAYTFFLQTKICNFNKNFFLNNNGNRIANAVPSFDYKRWLLIYLAIYLRTIYNSHNENFKLHIIQKLLYHYIF